MPLSSTSFRLPERLLVLFVLLAAMPVQALPEQAQRFYQVNFNDPLNQTPHRPATGASPNLPAGVEGNPRVVPALASMGQPLLLNTELVNGPCCYREEISFPVRGQADQYVISFDLLTARLLGSRNQFHVRLNESEEAVLTFSGDGMMLWSGGGAVARFQDDRLLHVTLTVDRRAARLILQVNGEEVHAAPTPLDNLRMVQFGMSSADGLTPEQIDPEPFAALDNIVIADGHYQYVNLQTRIGTATRQADDILEFSVQVRNLSDHPAHDVVLTHLLPAGAELVSARSDFWSCQPVRSHLLCTAPELAAMSQASVTLNLRMHQPGQWLDFTSIAVSGDVEVDNTDNRGKARLGGSAGWLLLGALLLLPLRRRA